MRRKSKPSYPYTGKEKERPCPCGARGEACMTCPWDQINIQKGDNIKMAKKLFCDACDYKNGVVCTKKNKPINKHTTNCKYYSIEKRFPEKPYAPNYADMSPF